MTGKQKRYLRAMGSLEEPVLQVGKGGVTDHVIQQADEALEARELIKVRILRNCPQDVAGAVAAVAAGAGAEVVQVIGRNALLFRVSREKPKILLP